MNTRGTNKTRNITIISAAILAAVYAVALIICIVPHIRTESVIKGISEHKNEVIGPGKESKYPFECRRSGFDSIVFFVSEGDAKALKVSVSLKDKKYLKNVRITDKMLSPEGSATAVKLVNKDHGRFKTGRYTVKIKNTSSSPVTIVRNTNDALTVRLFVNTRTGRYIFIAVCCLLLVFAVTSIRICLKDGISQVPPVEKLFLAAAIPLCLAFIFLIPPWSTGDSEAHYLACYRLSNLFLGQSGKNEWMGRPCDVAFFKNIWWNATPPSTGGYAIIRNNLKLFDLDKTLIKMSATSEKMNYYSVFCYIPQTAALVFGRIIGFGPVLNCYFAKLITAVFYIILCYRAIKKAPFGKEIIALCAILPSSLMMSNAFSYDPMVIITALNFISSVLLLRSKPDDQKAFAYVCIWSFILGAVKGGGYLILLPLVFIIPARSKGFKPLGKILPLILGLFSVFLFDMVLPSGGLFQFGSKGNGFMTASFAYENPAAYLIMAVKSYGRFFVEMISDLFGSKLCWGEQTIPAAFSFIMFVILILISASDEGISSLKAKDLLIFALVIIIALLTTPAMLLSWTPEGSDVILGIQGHYFLPVLPLFALLTGKGIRTISGKALSGKKNVSVLLKKVAYPSVMVMMFIAFFFILRLYLSR